MKRIDAIRPAVSGRGTFLAFALALGAAFTTAGHDAPGDVVHALTHRIETNGPTARLLAARAFEYQYLAQWDAAIADFEAALALQPRYGAALNGLAQTLLRQGHLERAESAARQGLALEPSPDKQAPYHAIIARAHARAERWEPALAAWRAALQSPRPDVDWYLGEAECLARLGQYAARADALERAKAKNPSVVLHRAWILALVEADRFDVARPEIEAGLARANWKSTWLLLRARLHARQGNRAAQEADARAALEEINLRWSWEHPDRDPYLFAYAGLAFGLMGQADEAREHLAKARLLGVPEGRLFEFEQALEGLAR